jgi:hypothetical protein
MIKFIIQSPELYKKLSARPIVKKLIFFDFRNLSQIKDEAAFFKAITQLRMPNGIYKKTNANRFNDIDTALLRLLDTNTIYKIHDVAVSDGITSTDLYNTLQQHSIKTDFHISDKFASIYCEPKWYGATYKDADGNVLYNDFLKIQAYRFTSMAFAVTKLLGHLFSDKSTVKSADKEILMLNPKTMALMDAGKISFAYFDIFEIGKNENTYDVVRCMNVLNYKVFPDDAITEGVKNLVASVKEGGIFILGRTQDATAVNNVSIFRKNGTHISLIRDINNGSEVKHLIKDLIG